MLPLKSKTEEERERHIEAGWKEWPPVPSIYYVVVELQTNTIEYGNKDLEITKKYFEDNHKKKSDFQIIKLIEFFWDEKK